MKHPNAQIQTLLNSLANTQLATIDLSLDRIENLLQSLGNPQDRLPAVIHIAGTNGKGSLAAYLTAIFQAANYRVHRFTSPYLVRINEEIILANSEITDEALLCFLQAVAAKTQQYPVTYFEAITAAAFLAFAETPADILILETGLGGRLDATNVVAKPAVTVITPISLDHTEFLGNTIAAIAGEKAGIIKPGVPCVVGPQVEEAMKVIEERGQALLRLQYAEDSTQLESKNPHLPLMGPMGTLYHKWEKDSVQVFPYIYRYNHEWSVKVEPNGFHYSSPQHTDFLPLPNLVGSHQIYNAATAIAVIDCLLENSHPEEGWQPQADGVVDKIIKWDIPPEAIRSGITNVLWPARLQKLSQGKLATLLPPNSELWLDGGHNPSAGQVIAAWAKLQSKPIHLICGMLKTKDSKEFLRPLAPFIQSLQAVSIPDEPLSQTPEKLSGIACQLDIQSDATESIKQAIQNIIKKEKQDCIILICGSLYLAGHVLWENKN